MSLAMHTRVNKLTTHGLPPVLNTTQVCKRRPAGSAVAGAVGPG